MAVGKEGAISRPFDDSVTDPVAVTAQLDVLTELKYWRSLRAAAEVYCLFTYAHGGQGKFLDGSKIKWCRYLLYL